MAAACALHPLPEPLRPTSWRFARLHFGGGRDGVYTAAELSTWARRVAQWLRRGDVHVFLNNDWQAFAPRNAAALRAACDPRSAGHPGKTSIPNAKEQKR